LAIAEAQFFYKTDAFLSPNHECQSTEGFKNFHTPYIYILAHLLTGLILAAINFNIVNIITD